jgi:hypothetical protein
MTEVLIYTMYGFICGCLFGGGIMIWLGFLLGIKLKKEKDKK